ncbi:hypothetical protein ZWY2020_001692, partial [Hordeum vulgare]
EIVPPKVAPPRPVRPCILQARRLLQPCGHLGGPRSNHTQSLQKLKTGKDPRISGAWLHTHNLYRGTDQERICSQRTGDREDFDKAMKNAHGENWEEEHPDLDGQIIYEAAGRMPHGRLGIANELFSKKEKVKFKYKRVMASEPNGMGSRTGGSTSHGNDDEDDYYDNEGDDNYVEDDLYGDEQYDNYGDDGYNDYEDGGYNDYGHGDVDWP